MIDLNNIKIKENIWEKLKSTIPEEDFNILYEELQDISKSKKFMKHIRNTSR